MRITKDPWRWCQSPACFSRLQLRAALSSQLQKFDALPKQSAQLQKWPVESEESSWFVIICNGQTGVAQTHRQLYLPSKVFLKKSFLFHSYLLCVHESFACMHVCESPGCLVPEVVRRGSQMSWNQSYRWL